MVDEVSQNGQIHHQKSHFHPGDAMVEFNNLQREERRRDDCGQIFCPGLFEQKANALEDAETCIAEDEEAESTQDVVVYQGGLVQQEADEAAFGVAVECMDDIHQDIRQIFMDQFERPDADGYEQDGLQKLVGGNQLQPAIVQLVWSSAGHEQGTPGTFKQREQPT